MTDDHHDATDANNDQEGSRLQNMLAMAVGALLTIIGGWATFSYARVLLTRPDGANGLDAGYLDVSYSGGGLVLLILWLATSVLLLITGLCLIYSGWTRKAYDLVPGPTLYLLGLCIVGIGICLLLVGQFATAIGAILFGIAVCYWEWAYEIS